MPLLGMSKAGSIGIPSPDTDVRVVDIELGEADKYRGETVKAFVVAKEGETLSEKEIIGFCREKLAAYKVPKIIESRKELPKSALGKILRKVLRDEEAARGS